MNDLVTPSFLRNLTTAALVLNAALVLGPWAIRVGGSALSAGTRDDARAACKDAQGTFILGHDGKPHCFGCASPAAVRNFP